MIHVLIPLKTVSESNIRCHWTVRAKRAKAQRKTAWAYVRSATAYWTPKPQPPLTITLTRRASRKLDSDNLPRALKAVRDGIADALGIDDGDPQLLWCYAQSGRTEDYPYAVTVEIEEGVT